MAESTLVHIRNLNKTFQTGNGNVEAIRNLELQIREGEFITVIGPSGCGKSTLLKIVAGLDISYEGSVELGGKQIVGPGIDKGFIFQEPRLFPWLTVEKNIAADLSLTTDRACSLARVRKGVPPRAVRWDGAARGDRQSTSAQPKGAAARRAIRRSRCVHTLTYAGGAARYLAEESHHDGVCNT